jgi:Zinc finger, C3HC4 type (RING finger)/Ankyrin repeat
MTPLQLAAARGCFRIVMMLLRAGAPVDARDNTHESDFPWTALASSCLLAHAGMMTQLLQYGADPCLRCNGMLPVQLSGLGLPPEQRECNEIERMRGLLTTAVRKRCAEAAKFAVRPDALYEEQVVAIAAAAAVTAHPDDRPQLSMDCFKPVEKVTEYSVLCSRRSSAETECGSYGYTNDKLLREVSREEYAEVQQQSMPSSSSSCTSDSESEDWSEHEWSIDSKQRARSRAARAAATRAAAAAAATVHATDMQSATAAMHKLQLQEPTPVDWSKATTTTISSGSTVAVTTGSSKVQRELAELKAQLIAKQAEHIKTVKQLVETSERLEAALQCAQRERDAVRQQYNAAKAALDTAQREQNELSRTVAAHRAERSASKLRAQQALACAENRVKQLQQQLEQQQQTQQLAAKAAQEATDALTQERDAATERCNGTTAALNTAEAHVMRLQNQLKQHSQNEARLLKAKGDSDKATALVKKQCADARADAVNQRERVVASQKRFLHAQAALSSVRAELKAAQRERSAALANATAAQQACNAAVEEAACTKSTVHQMRAVERQLYHGLALRAARYRRGAVASREDTISDVRDRAALAVLSTLLPFSQRDALAAIAAAEVQCKQEAAAATAAQEAQDKAVAAALTTAYAAQDAAVATAVAQALAAALTDHEAAQAAAVAAANRAAAVQQAQAVAAAVAAAKEAAAVSTKQAVAAAACEAEDYGMCMACMSRRSNVLYLPCRHICSCRECHAESALGDSPKCMVCSTKLLLKKVVYIS